MTKLAKQIPAALTALSAMLLLLLVVSAKETIRSSSPRENAPPAAKKPDDNLLRLSETYGKLPLSFEVNRGQVDSQVKFLSRGSGYTLFLTPTEAVLKLAKPSPVAGDDREQGKMLERVDGEKAQRPHQSAVVRMQLLHSNRKAKIEGIQELPGHSNYFIGSDPKQWRSGLATYGKVKYENVYPGIDLVYYGNQRQLEYDFIVSPGADLKNITLAFKGAERLELDSVGNLLLHTQGGKLQQHKPIIYQVSGNGRKAVAGGYVLQGRNQVGFQVSEYDNSKPLVIDPQLVYSTYLGGSGDGGYGRGIAVDSAGFAYVTGVAASNDFPTTTGAFDTTCGNGTCNGSVDNSDAFVTKLNAAGTALVYSTYLGGSSSYEEGIGIAVDSAGSAYVTGRTASTDFPTTTGAFDTTCGTDGTCNGRKPDAFVTKLNAAGDALVYSTYLGGSSSYDVGEGIAVDSAGSAYVSGETASNDFPTTTGAFDRICGTTSCIENTSFDAFVTKLNAAGTALVYSTYLGGNGVEHGHRIAVDSAGSAYVTGSTSSNDFPTTTGAFDTTCHTCTNAFGDAFVTKLNAAGDALVYSTYLGGSGNDFGVGIAVDSAGSAYVTGGTSSSDFPTTTAAFDMTCGTNGTCDGIGDAFVTKLNAVGNALVYSTYLGGGSFDQGLGIALGSAGSAYVSGYTTSNNFPTTIDAFDTTCGTNGPCGGFNFDAFVTKLDAAGNALVYSTYLGGNSLEYGYEIAVDSAGSAYVSGLTYSTDFPTTMGALDTTCGTDGTCNGGNRSAFIAKIGDVSNNVAPVITSTLGPIGPLAVGTPAVVVAVFSDANTLDTHTCTFSWDDGQPSSNGTIAETAGSGSCTGSRTFGTAGVYSVQVSVSDNHGANTSKTFEFVVVYDPSAGFVTGGGWIDSPTGAYLANPNLTGHANFGFVSKYKKGTNIPEGQTEFQFEVADFNFHSTAYQWLVVAGPKAQYKGTGTVNGTGNYGFLLMARDGQQPGGGGVDKFRIKVWDKSNDDAVVYDNVLEGSEDIDSANPQALGGGSIVIHNN
jgi:hypothetical protein